MIYIVFYGRNKPAVVNDGAGPDKNMLTPSAILPCKVGRLTNLVPRLWYLCLRDARLLLISARHFTYNKVCGRITPFFQGGQWNNRNITPEKINISINLCLCYKASKAKTMFFLALFIPRHPTRTLGLGWFLYCQSASDSHLCCTRTKLATLRLSTQEIPGWCWSAFATVAWPNRPRLRRSSNQRIQWNIPLQRCRHPAGKHRVSFNNKS